MERSEERQPEEEQPKDRSIAKEPSQPAKKEFKAAESEEETEEKAKDAINKAFE